MRILPMLLAGAALAVALPAAAAVTTYTDRTTFNTATSPTLFENFNGFDADTSFATSPVTASYLTVSASPGASSIYNKIDVAPHVTGESDVDGTPSINALTQAGISVFLTFNQALSAFGADFRALQDNEFRTAIFINGFEVDPTVTSGNQTRFLGFASDTPFTSIEFRGIQNDAFGIDNTAAATGGVPEPATWALMLGGFGLAGAALRSRRRHAVTA